MKQFGPPSLPHFSMGTPLLSTKPSISEQFFHDFLSLSKLQKQEIPPNFRGEETIAHLPTDIPTHI